MVELLGHPDLADTRGEGAASLIDDVVDGVDRRGAPMKNCSGGHVFDNPPGPRRYSLSLRSRQVRRLVPVGEAPQSLALIDHGETIEDPSGELVADRRIYVLNARSGTVSVVSVVFFDRVFDTFSVGQDLGVVADGHRGKSIYVTTHNAILVIDGGTDRIVGTIQLGHAPWLIAVSPDGSRIYASHPKEDLISVVDTTTPFPSVSTFAVPPGPSSLALSPDGAKLYVAHFGTHAPTGDFTGPGAFSVIDTGTKHAQSVPLGDGPTAMVAGATRAFVSNFTENTVSVIDITTSPRVIDTIAVDRAGLLLLSPDERTLYVSTFGPDTVVVLDVSN